MKARQRKEGLRDQLLVLRCQQGDRDAFEALVARWEKRLWLFARRLTGDTDAAWDVIQETWLAVIHQLHKLTQPDMFRSWVFRIVNNKCIDWHRRNKRAPEPLDEGEMELPSISPVSEEAQAVLEVLKNLPDTLRAVLYLKVLEGFDVREIAEIMGVPEGTVKSRLYTAREQLKRYLE